jgi:integrase
VIRASRSRGGPIGLSKSGRERRVALSRRLRLHLRELWMRAGQPAAGLVVPGVEAANYRHRHFRRVCRAARIGEQCRPKDLRDSYASWLLTCGIQLGYVSRQLGHADVALTARHYARWTGDDAYRQPVEVGPGEVPADLLAWLSRTGLAGTPEGRDGAETALDGAELCEGEGGQKHQAPETSRFRAL